MKLNQNSHFSMTPAAVNMQRSVLDRSSELLTTFDAAKIIPIYCDEILPGDSVKMKHVNSLVRMTTSIHPTMDRAYLDTYFFFIPTRLVYENWEEFNGENPNPWTLNAPVHSIPQITLTASDTGVGSLANYLGIPVGYAGQVNSLPFRCYNKIYNDWFRNTNLQSEVAIVTGDTGDLIAYYDLKKATKFKDFYTAALPSPQRGPDIDIPLGTAAPVFTSGNNNTNFTGYALRWRSVGSTDMIGNGDIITIRDADHNSYNATSGASVTSNSWLQPANLYADLSRASAATINQLRLAFQTQKFYERMGIATGGRYISVLKTMFGVTSPDYRLQRSEYLGGARSLINMTQVTQTSETSTTALGTVAGQSVSRSQGCSFHKGFTEHGYILGVAVVRTKHTYAYGLHKMWSRKELLDFYWPTFAFIGEQPILNKEIYAQGTSADDQVFGYQEAWAEYRYAPNRVNGYFTPGVTGSLESWHYADKYNALPTLGSAWIEETDANINRTLAVQSGTHQFFGHFAFDCDYTRVMPVYSVPGLIDHF